MKNLPVIVIVIFCLFSEAYSQTEPNLKIIQNLIDSSSVIILNKLQYANKIGIEVNTPADLFYLRNSILKSFSDKTKLSDSSNIQLKYNLDDARVRYSKLEKEKFFSNYDAERKITISGNYIIFRNGESFAADDFNLSETTFCIIEKIADLENTALPFTKGKIPEEPFWGGLYEPLIAVSAIAVTIYLLFSVRSK